MTYRAWLYSQLGLGGSSGSSEPWVMEEVIVNGVEAETVEFQVEGGKRYILKHNYGMDEYFSCTAVEDSPLESEIVIYYPATVEMHFEGIPASVKFTGVEPPGDSDENKEMYYVISIRNNEAVCAEFSLGE